MHVLPHAVPYLCNAKLSFTGKHDSDIYSGSSKVFGRILVTCHYAVWMWSMGKETTV